MARVVIFWVRVGVAVDSPPPEGPDTCCQHVPKDDFGHICGRHGGPLQGFFDDHGAQLMHGDGGQDAVESA